MSTPLQNRRRLMMVSGGFEIGNYIELSEGAYIDSGVKAHGTLKIEYQFAFTSIVSSWAFGARVTINRDGFGVLNQIDQNYIRFQYANLINNNNRPCLNDLNVHTIVIDQGKCYLDDVQRENWSGSSFTSNNNIYFATLNNNGGADLALGQRIYHVKVWDNGELICDFVPAKLNGKAGLWDNVSSTMFKNAGTGRITLH